MGHERRHSNPIHAHQCKDDNFILTTSSANHSHMNNDHERLMPLGLGGDKSYLRQRPHSTAVHTMLPPLPAHVLPSMLPGQVHTQVATGLSDGISLGKDEPRSMDEALNILSTSLEDFQGHYPELRHLEEVVQSLEYLVRVSINRVIWK